MGETDVLTVLDSEKQKTQQATSQNNTEQESQQEEQSDHGSFLFDALSDEEVNGVLKSMRRRLVVLIGLPRSGKSTFVGSLYHILMTRSSLGSYRLIGSDTYVGLERRIYLRYAHGQNISDTMRTGSIENHLLTLELENKDSKVTVQLFLSDRTGERYKNYAEEKKDMSDDISLLSAEHLYVFVAADTLAGRDYLTVKEKYVKIATLLKEAGVIEKAKTVAIVFNKIDLVKDEQDRFARKKSMFLEALKETLGVEEIENYDVQSNDMKSDELKSLMETLIGNAFHEYEEGENESLDWVKKEMGKYLES